MRQILLPAFCEDQEVVMEGPIVVAVKLAGELPPMEGGQELLLSAERLRGPGRPRIPFSPVRITGSLVVDRELQATFPGPGTYRWRWALGGPKASGTSLADQLAENPGGEWRIEEASHGTTLEIEPPAQLSPPGSGG